LSSGDNGNDEEIRIGKPWLERVLILGINTRNYGFRLSPLVSSNFSSAEKISFLQNIPENDLSEFAITRFDCKVLKKKNYFR
jgi:hypothetical protein